MVLSACDTTIDDESHNIIRFDESCGGCKIFYQVTNTVIKNKNYSRFITIQPVLFVRSLFYAYMYE